MHGHQRVGVPAEGPGASRREESGLTPGQIDAAREPLPNSSLVAGQGNSGSLEPIELLRMGELRLSMEVARLREELALYREGLPQALRTTPAGKGNHEAA